MTKVFVINVPAQKNFGGRNPVCINATIHGNVPRAKSFPPIIIPISIFGAPQVPVSLRDRLSTNPDDSNVNAQTAIAMKIFLIIAFNFQC